MSWGGLPGDASHYCQVYVYNTFVVKILHNHQLHRTQSLLAWNPLIPMSMLVVLVVCVWGGGACPDLIQRRSKNHATYATRQALA